MASASLSGISMLNSYEKISHRLTPSASFAEHTSSIAMTTSTVSKLSSPRSFVKCEEEASCVH